jgi:probable F420-dependent oxidoreductase
VDRGGTKRHRDRLVAYLDGLDTWSPTVPRELRVLAANGPQMLASAKKRSAGAHPFLVTPEHTRQARELLGHGPLLAPQQKAVLETDPPAARWIPRRGLAFYLDKPNYLSVLRRLGFANDDFAGDGSDRLERVL